MGLVTGLYKYDYAEIWSRDRFVGGTKKQCGAAIILSFDFLQFFGGSKSKIGHVD